MSELSDLALEYRHLDEVSSTNDYLRTYTPSADITVVSASFQTKGRGQMGNTWISDAGENALFSILVYPKNLKASDGFVLSQAMALSIKEVLDGYLDGISIKWPNDIYCGSEKICGTLIENVLMGKFVGRSVIGNGINVNQTLFPDGLAAPATSLRIYIKRIVSPNDIIRSVTERFAQHYEEVQAGCYVHIREKYHRHLYLRGERHCFQDETGTFTGTISHVEPDGHIIIMDEDGLSRRYAFKQVKFKR